MTPASQAGETGSGITPTPMQKRCNIIEVAFFQLDNPVNGGTSRTGGAQLTAEVYHDSIIRRMVATNQESSGYNSEGQPLCDITSFINPHNASHIVRLQLRRTATVGYHFIHQPAQRESYRTCIPDRHG